MHIEQLRLAAFGPFTEYTIDLSPGLNILYGPNEAGKSSALRAIRSLLFGVPSRTSDDFLHNYRQLRIGGVLVREDGERLECVRRKGNKATLRDWEDEKQLDESVLDRFLGAIDEDFFRSVFGIDHEQLRAGGQEVVRGEGRVGELLFVAGGVSHLREAQQKLESTTAELFKPRAHQPRINSVLSRLEQLRGEVREAQASSEEWGRLEAERTGHLRRAESLKEELADAEAARERLCRIKAAWPTLANWKERYEELHALGGAVLLPEDAETRHTQVHQQLSLAKSTLRQSHEQIGRLDEQLQTLQAPDAILREQERIDSLYRQLGSHEKDARDRGTLEARRRAARNNARQSMERLGWSMSLDEAKTNRLPDDKKVLIRSLAKRHGELTQRLNSAKKINDRAADRLKELQEQRTEASVDRETKGLAQELARAVALLDVSEGLQSRREMVERLRREAEEALARTPLWSGNLDDLRRLKVPSEAVVEEFDERLRDTATRLEAIQGRLRENTEKETQLLEKLVALEKSETVPSEGELLEARATRDQGIRLAVETLEARPTDPLEVKEFVREAPEGDSLASALGPSVRKADVVADRLRREADHVAEKAQLIVQLESLRREASNLKASTAATEDEQRQYGEEWNERWKEAGLVPMSPSEMRAWLRQYAQLLEKSGDLSAQTESLSWDESRCALARGALADELSQFGIQVEVDELTDVIAVAREFVERLRAAQARQEQLASDLKHVKQEVVETDKELRAAEAEVTTWRVSWAKAMSALQLSDDALPEQAETVLTNLEQLFRELDEADGYEARVWGIDKTAEEFAEAARGLASVVAPEIADRPVEELVAALNARITEARRVDQRIKTLAEQREAQEVLARDAEAKAAEAQAVLEGLLSEAACKTVQELSRAIERSDQKRRLQQQVGELKVQLAPYCGGQSLEELQADASTEDPDRLATKISETESVIARLREEREESLTAAERVASALTKYDGGDAAAEKEAERQCLASQLEEDVREYVVMSVAAALLRRAIERYQERAQGPVLTLASNYFKKLTCGAFTGLRFDYDDAGNDILVGVRPDGNAILEVEGMSEGSRDQLYLALRLATIEHWFDNHEPVPFVVDDILLSFDDSRAEATLEALLQLSARTQVLFFTHHDHLVKLTKKVADSCGGDSTVHLVSAWNAVI